MTGIKVLDGMVLIRPRPKKKSVIDIVGTRLKGLDYENIGRVEKVGGGGCPVRVGEEVVFPVYAGQDVERGGERFLLMSFDSILGTVE